MSEIVMNKEFHLWMNKDYRVYINLLDIKFSYTETMNAIKNGMYRIDTTQVCILSFDLMKSGYRLFIHFDIDNIVEVKLGVQSDRGYKDLRMEHNLQKLLLTGFFDPVLKEVL